MLSDTDRAMIDLAGEFWRHEALREAAMRERFDLTPTRFWQRVNTLIELPEALMHSPIVVNRLRARRAGARGRRSARRLAV